MSRLLLFTGMTPNAGTFRHQVDSLPNAKVVEWLAPEPDETLTAYSDRMASHLADEEPAYLAGLSFGGIVALEVACRIKVAGCFLISSIRSPSELPPRLKMFRSLRHVSAEHVFKSVGAIADAIPRFLRTRSIARLSKFAHDEGRWHRWSTAAVLGWAPHSAIELVLVLRIHGDSDRTFPARYLNADVIVRQGGHELPLTHPEEVTVFLRDGMRHFATAYDGGRQTPLPSE